jgi:hypothetical protein
LLKYLCKKGTPATVPDSSNKVNGIDIKKVAEVILLFEVTAPIVKLPDNP